MEPPCLGEEQTPIGRNGVMRAEDVVQGRNSNAIRMASLNRLLQLPRVSQQDDALRSLCDGQHVCESHLRGFIDKQHVDAKACVRPGPEIRCPAADGTSRLQRTEGM